MSRSRGAPAPGGALAVVALILAASAAVAAGAGPPAAAPPPGLVAARVVAVLDGDTIDVTVEGRRLRVRYIGIDAPETSHPTRGEQPGGRAARAANRRLVSGRWVFLETDVRQHDDYGRLLAHVWLPRRDGSRLLVNAELVSQGWARVTTIPPNVRHVATLVRAQREARAARRGLWGGEPGPGPAARSRPSGG